MCSLCSVNIEIVKHAVIIERNLAFGKYFFYPTSQYIMCQYIITKILYCAVKNIDVYV